MCLACPVTRRGVATALACIPALPAMAGEGTALVEPRMRLAQPEGIALTLDCCGGGFDDRIAGLLVEARIPATLFVTALWLRRNGAAMDRLRQHPDLFGFGNHGGRHLAAVLGGGRVFGQPGVGDLAGLRQEMAEGAAAIEQAGGGAPRWFRGATARYSRDALPAIRDAGFAIAGYSLNADGGASLPAATVAARVGRAVPGDVILGHLNHPERPAGAGIAAGIAALHRRGARFIRLDQRGPAEVAYATEPADRSAAIRAAS